MEEDIFTVKDANGKIVAIRIYDLIEAISGKMIFGLSSEVILALRKEYLRRGGKLLNSTPEDVEKTFSSQSRQLLEVLQESNCSKCRYVGRMFMQTKCFWNADSPKLLFYDNQMPIVCKRFETLREGERLDDANGSHNR